MPQLIILLNEFPLAITSPVFNLARSHTSKAVEVSLELSHLLLMSLSSSGSAIWQISLADTFSTIRPVPPSSRSNNYNLSAFIQNILSPMSSRAFIANFEFRWHNENEHNLIQKLAKH